MSQSAGGLLRWQFRLVHRLLDASIAWLLEQFDGRGWSTPSTVAEQFNDGFTLQVFTVLLQAEAAGRVDLPDRVREMSAACSSTFRCRDTAGIEMGRGAVSSVTVASRSASSARIARRVGSASAENTALR